MFRLLARVPLPLMRWLGAWMGWLVWLASPRYRRRFLENARAAGVPPRDWRRAVAAAGTTVAEAPWLWLRPQGASVLDRVRWQGEARFEAALDAGRGVILITPHLGSWEMCGQALAERYGTTRGPLVAMFRPARQAWLAPLVARSRERPGFKTVPTNLAGVRSLIKILRSGGFTGILPDQVPPMGQGVWAPFFGRPAYTMTLVARLAQQTGAPVLLCWCQRERAAPHYTVRFEPVDAPEFADRNAAPEAAAAALNAALERVIVRCPQQYLWSYARYKQPRGEA